MEYPALFRASDEASKNAQTTYLRLFRSTLALLTLGALVGALSIGSEQWDRVTATFSAVSLGLSLLLNTTLKIQAPEKHWFNGRAIAESVKSLSWRYVTGGVPFGVELPQAKVDAQFLEQIRSIMRERSGLAAKFGGQASESAHITPEMRTCRSKPAQERLALYLKDRIRDQRNWYASKSSAAESANTRWFWIGTFGQAAALSSAIVMIQLRDSLINPTGAFSAVAAASMAWLQMKNYQDLAQSYGMAAMELSLIEEQAAYVESEADLAAFVANAENAISREHTMWAARRDVGLKAAKTE